LKSFFETFMDVSPLLNRAKRYNTGMANTPLIIDVIMGFPPSAYMIRAIKGMLPNMTAATMTAMIPNVLFNALPPIIVT